VQNETTRVAGDETLASGVGTRATILGASVSSTVSPEGWLAIRSPPSRSASEAKDGLSQVSLRECNTRPGFQVTFEGDSALLVVEFNYNINGPGSMLRGVNARACVVLRMSIHHIRGQASVIPRWVLGVLEDVDKALEHGSALSKHLAAQNAPKICDSILKWSAVVVRA
jgi:hypothetical protein